MGKNEKTETKGDGPEDYFATEIHARRMKTAIDREAKRLADIGRVDPLMALSEAVGVWFGVAHFFRQLGMKHTVHKTLHGVFAFLRSGTK